MGMFKTGAIKPAIIPILPDDTDVYFSVTATEEVTPSTIEKLGIVENTTDKAYIEARDKTLKKFTEEQFDVFKEGPPKPKTYIKLDDPRFGAKIREHADWEFRAIAMGDPKGAGPEPDMSMLDPRDYLDFLETQERMGAYTPDPSGFDKGYEEKRKKTIEDVRTRADNLVCEELGHVPYPTDYGVINPGQTPSVKIDCSVMKAAARMANKSHLEELVKNMGANAGVCPHISYDPSAGYNDMMNSMGAMSMLDISTSSQDSDMLNAMRCVKSLLDTATTMSKMGGEVVSFASGGQQDMLKSSISFMGLDKIADVGKVVKTSGTASTPMADKDWADFTKVCDLTNIPHGEVIKDKDVFGISQPDIYDLNAINKVDNNKSIHHYNDVVSDDTLLMLNTASVAV